MLDTHSIQSPSLQHRARGTDHNSWKEIARIYMVFSFGFPPTQTIYSSGQKPWSASDWNLYPQLGKHHSPPPHFPSLSQHTTVGPRCISPTQHLLSRVPGHQTKCRNPRSPESSSGFFFAACVERRRSCTTVACSVRNCSFAKTRLHRNLCSRTRK